MSGLEKVGSLDVNQDLAFTRKVWTFQRVGWVAMALLLAAAMAGAFGHGPVASATASDPTGTFAVEHDRVIRHKTEYQTVFRFGPALTKGGQVQLWLSRAYLEKHDIMNMEPEPEGSVVQSDRLVYTFRVEEPGAPAEVRFITKSDGYGPAPGQAGVPGGPEVALDEFVMP